VPYDYDGYGSSGNSLRRHGVDQTFLCHDPG
jgi:hypothetical protein